MHSREPRQGWMPFAASTACPFTIAESYGIVHEWFINSMNLPGSTSDLASFNQHSSLQETYIWQIFSHADIPADV